MTEQDSPLDVVEEIPFTQHPGLKLEDVEIGPETSRETVHETTNFRRLFRAYLTVQSAIQGSEVVDEAVLAALKADANPVERAYLDTVAQNWQPLSTGFLGFAEAHPRLYQKMTDYVQRQNEIAKARKI